MNIRKTVCYTAVLLLSAIFFTACNNSNDKSGAVKRDSKMAQSKAHIEPDSTIMVTVDKLDGDTIKVSTINEQREYRLSVNEAQAEKKIFGSLTEGDTLAITAYRKKHVMTSSINITELLGLWMYGNDGQGMRLDKDRVVASINMGNVTLKNWNVKNDQLSFSYTISLNPSEKGNDKEENIRINILTKNRLNITIEGKDYDCKKQGLLMKSGDLN